MVILVSFSFLPVGGACVLLYRVMFFAAQAGNELGAQT